MEPQTKRLILFLTLPSLLLALLINVYYVRPQPDYKMHVHFYDVGQGDSTFIQTFAGNQILIDGGPDNSLLPQLAADMPFFDKVIEMVIVSHPHADHVAGLDEVLKKYRIKEIVMPDDEFSSPPYDEFLKLIKQYQIKVTYAHEGQRIYLDQSTVFDIYYPPAGHYLLNNSYDGITTTKRNPNDVSIVGMLIFGKTKFLFPGDAGQGIEDAILPTYNLDADVLKVGHHGSKYSSSMEFLAEVTPVFSVIEVGKNSYGHPTPEALDRLKNINSTILRTDQNSAVKFTSDGYAITLDK